MALSELLERFAFFGAFGLLSLFLNDRLSEPDEGASIWGLRWLIGLAGLSESAPFQVASILFGLTSGSAYLATILSGWVADRFLGRPRTIALGGLLAVAGYLSLAADRTFLVGLVLVVIGSGAFKGNIVSEFGALFAPDDPRREEGFRLLFIAIAIGILAAPLVCGALGEKHDWRFGFLAAAAGMAASVAVFIGVAAGAIAAPWRRPSGRLGRGEGWRGQRTASLTVLLLLLAASFTGSQQIYNAYLGWAGRSLYLTVFGVRTPTTWLLAMDTVAQLLALSLLAWGWRAWRRLRPEPDALTKISLGCALVATAYVCLALFGARQDRLDPLLIVAFHVLNSLGYAIVFPVSLAFLTARAGERAQSTVVGLFYLQFAVASVLAGVLGRWLEILPAQAFWLLHAALLAVAAGAVLALRGWLDSALGGEAHRVESPSPGAQAQTALPKSYACGAASPAKGAFQPQETP